jgi:hypothetical protein
MCVTKQKLLYVTIRHKISIVPSNSLEVKCLQAEWLQLVRLSVLSFSITPARNTDLDYKIVYDWASLHLAFWLNFLLITPYGQRPHAQRFDYWVRRRRKGFNYEFHINFQSYGRLGDEKPNFSVLSMKTKEQSLIFIIPDDSSPHHPLVKPV